MIIDSFICYVIIGMAWTISANLRFFKLMIAFNDYWSLLIPLIKGTLSWPYWVSVTLIDWYRKKQL
jgi:hypothetical protein